MAENKDAEKAPETTAQRDDRVRQAEEDRAARLKKSPVTGATSFHDVVRHLLTHGPARNDAERDELLGVIDDDDPGHKNPGAAPADGQADRLPFGPAAPAAPAAPATEKES